MPADMRQGGMADTSDTFGLWHPLNYAIDTWLAYRDHGVYAYAGAYNDQPQIWLDDMRALNSRYARHFDEAQSELETARKER